MKFKKSLLALFFAAAMLITSACGQNGNNGENTDTDGNGEPMVTLIATNTIAHEDPPGLREHFRFKGTRFTMLTEIPL